MPVFQEASNEARDLRILPSRALPLPRLSPPLESHKPSGEDEHREVVVIGAGPSGLFLTLLLARYGITGSSLLCLDSKPGTLKAGQADGLQPRTLEVLQSLGIASEVISEGCHMEEVAFWNPMPNGGLINGNEDGSKGGGIARTDFVPDVNVAARFPFEVTIHQGRIERILQENLQLYAPENTIRRSHRFLEYVADDLQSEFPILVKYEYDRADGTTAQGAVRTKYLVGADGARSLVRKCMGLQLEGETTDHIWGVCDFVAETDFPDIRKRSAVHSDAGSVMVIPREQIATGEYLTRLYVQVPGDIKTDSDSGIDRKAADKKRRSAVDLEYIFAQARAVFSPYKIGIREGTVPDWYAAYQIGQRMTPKFSLRTSDGVDRVFIVGDACHTHSPKAGQGMNVSMMDSYNLAWKLVHSINGLTPRLSKGKADPVLETFEQERVDTARQLIDFDTKFSHMFSGKIGSEDELGLTHEEFLRVFSEGSGFTSGCGLQYQPSTIVKTFRETDLSKQSESTTIGGALKPGRRLLSVELKRYADATARQLHDEIPSTGRYRIVILTSNDLLDKEGVSQHALKSCIDITQMFPPSMIELAIIHPISKRFEWTDLPPSVKKFAEMRVYGLAKKEDAYEIFGISKDEGVITVVRPDGAPHLQAAPPPSTCQLSLHRLQEPQNNLHPRQHTFIATVKRARKFLDHIEKRRGGTIQLSKYNNGSKGDQGDVALRRELENVVSGRGKGGKDGEAEEVIIKGTGKAVQRVLQLAVYFQGQGDLLVRIRTGSVGAVDDIVRRGEEREDGKEEGEMEDGEEDVDLPESRIRRTGCLELGISLR